MRKGWIMGRTMGKTTRVRGFAPWKPQRKTMALLDDVQAVLTEYASYWPLTIRQVFYRLVGTVEYGKTEKAYARLCETINRGRRAGLIDFDAFRDDGIKRLAPSSWSGPDQFRATFSREAERFRLDRQTGQPVRLWILCEAAGMAPMLAKVANTYGVPVLSSGGFDSLTAKRDLADALSRAEAAEVLHIGDHDPSGVHVFSSLAEDVGAMCIGLGGVNPEFSRLAVTMDQARKMDLPTAPAKETDNRSFEGETVQAEAIPPDVLSSILRDAIEARQCTTARAYLLDQEKAHRSALVAWSEGNAA